MSFMINKKDKEEAKKKVEKLEKDYKQLFEDVENLKQTNTNQDKITADFKKKKI